MKCPNCGANMYKSIGGIDICPECGFGSASAAQESARGQLQVEERIKTLPVESLHKKQEYQPADDRRASVGMTCSSRSLSAIVATCRPKSVR